jgi:hypothetical protein
VCRLIGDPGSYIFQGLIEAQKHRNTESADLYSQLVQYLSESAVQSLPGKFPGHSPSARLLAHGIPAQEAHQQHHPDQHDDPEHKYPFEKADPIELD